MSDWLDLTTPISDGMAYWPDNAPVHIKKTLSIQRGDAANVTEVSMSVHTATHVDAALHFLDDGPDVAALDLNTLIGPVHVVAIQDPHFITRAELEGLLLQPGERLLFKTRNSDFWNEPEIGFRTDFTYITPAAARALADSGVKLVGIDYLSVEAFGSADFATHITLLEKEVVILEGLDLREVPAGEYEIVCLPLKFIGGTGDGAPARTILRQKHDR
jgi:arylformamidase